MYQVTKICTLSGHQDSIYALAAAPVSYSFYSGGADGYVVQWQLDKEQLTQGLAQDVTGKLIAKTKNSCYALCYIPNNELLVIGDNFQGLHFIDLRSSQAVGSLYLDNSYIFDIQQVNQTIWVSCGSGTVFIIEIATLKIVHQLRASKQSARAIAVHYTHNTVAVGYSDDQIRLFNVSDTQLQQCWQAHKNSIFSLVYAPHTDWLLSGSRDAHLSIWGLQDGQYYLHQTIVAHLFTVNHLAYSPDGSHFITCSKDKSIKYWDSANFQLLKVIDKSRHAGHGTSVNKLLWLDNETFVSCSDDHSIAVWQVYQKIQNL